jgi:hypothetical protein
MICNVVLLLRQHYEEAWMLQKRETFPLASYCSRNNAQVTTK